MGINKRIPKPSGLFANLRSGLVKARPKPWIPRFANGLSVLIPLRPDKSAEIECARFWTELAPRLKDMPDIDSYLYDPKTGLPK